MYHKPIFVVLLITLTTGSCFAQGGRAIRRHQLIDFDALITSQPKSELSEQERAGLLIMREEEKLAHDVYVELSKKWRLRPLQNISQSEVMHMEAVRLLLDRYGIADPLEGKQHGQFATDHFQELYKQLVAQGSESQAAAIQVGLLIEELDIADLNQLMEQADNNDIRVIYQNLLKGSRNHLRAFWRMASRFNVEYTPEYLEKSEFDRIKLSKHERWELVTDPNYKF